MSSLIRRNLCILFVIALLTMSASAMAQECEQLGSNEEWQTGLQQVQQALDAANYDQVLSKGEELSFICARSPKLNYYIGSAHAAKGNPTDAAVYFEIASDAIQDFQTSPELMQKIYYARYEAEHPDRSEAAVSALNKENAQLIEEKSQLKRTNSGLENQLSGMIQKGAPNTACVQTTSDTHSCDAILTDKRLEDKAGLWTGIGVGIGGVILTVVGGVLIGTMDKYEHTGFHEESLDTDQASTYGKTAGTVKLQDYKISSGYIAGWTLLGTGLAITVTGAILSGIYGSKVHRNNDQLSFGISPNGIDFGMTF